MNYATILSSIPHWQLVLLVAQLPVSLGRAILPVEVCVDCEICNGKNALEVGILIADSRIFTINTFVRCCSPSQPKATAPKAVRLKEE